MRASVWDEDLPVELLLRVRDDAFGHAERQADGETDDVHGLLRPQVVARGDREDLILELATSSSTIARSRFGLDATDGAGDALPSRLSMRHPLERRDHVTVGEQETDR